MKIVSPLLLAVVLVASVGSFQAASADHGRRGRWRGPAVRVVVQPVRPVVVVRPRVRRVIVAQPVVTPVYVSPVVVAPPPPYPAEPIYYSDDDSYNYDSSYEGRYDDRDSYDDDSDGDSDRRRRHRHRHGRDCDHAQPQTYPAPYPQPYPQTYPAPYPQTYPQTYPAPYPQPYPGTSASYDASEAPGGVTVVTRPSASVRVSAPTVRVRAGFSIR